jgi:hypothetical protein
MKILKNANAAPDWVELGKDIRTEVATLRSRIRSWLDANGAISGTPNVTSMEQVRRLTGWATFEDELVSTIESVNANISRHNHIAPTAVVHIMPLRLEGIVIHAATTIHKGSVASSHTDMQEHETQ